MDNREFWSSPKGLQLKLDRRQQDIFLFDFKGELETKTSAKIGNSLSFQAELLSEMARQGRNKPFSQPLVVELNFTPSLKRTAPAIHTLAKHYLDLFQWSADKGPEDKSRFLLKDDRQVKGLICTYPLGIDHTEPGLQMRVTGMTNFIHNLQFSSRIIAGDSPGGVESRELNDFRRDMMEGSYYDHPVVTYREHLRNKDDFVERFGEDVYEVHRMFLQQQCQEGFLNSVELGPDRLGALLAPYLRRRKFRALDSLTEIMADQQRQLYSIVSVDLGASAVREGESSIFKEKVKSTLAQLKNERPLMFPLLTTIGVTILYVAPKSGKVIDVDNLARRVIPFVHSELHPPSTLAHAATMYESVRTSKWADENRQELKSLNRLPRDQVSKYQVFELRRSDSDPDDGKVELIIDAGLGSFGPWQKADEIIDAWKEAAKDS